MQAGPAPVLQLGDPRLRARCAPVGDVGAEDHLAARARLVATFAAFRARHGFGRAIAAPQIGVARRFVALDLGDGPRVIADPALVSASDATFELWDDCMSFPDLIVRVRRHARVVVEYTDEVGLRASIVADDRAIAELLQHELDHLDGVLAVDRATGPDAFASRAEFEAHPERFLPRAGACE